MKISFSMAYSSWGFSLDRTEIERKIVLRLNTLFCHIFSFPSCRTSMKSVFTTLFLYSRFWAKLLMLQFKPKLSCQFNWCINAYLFNITSMWERNPQQYHHYASKNFNKIKFNEQKCYVSASHKTNESCFAHIEAFNSASWNLNCRAIYYVLQNNLIKIFHAATSFTCTLFAEITYKNC